MGKDSKSRVGILEKITKQQMLILFLFVVFLIYLVAQHRLIGMYFDDFGNASLSYGYDSSEIKGTDYTIADLLGWSKYIYYNWGGRILYALMLIPLLKSGASIYMFIQAFIILGIVYEIISISRINNINSNVCLSMFAVLLGYGSLKGDIIKDGIYWASASVLYVWPMLFFFCSILLYYKIEKLIKENQKIKKRYYIILMITIPLVTLSQEQIGGAFLVWIIMQIIVMHWKRERNYLKLDIPYLIYSLITFGLFFSTPGNWVRLGSDAVYANMSLVEKITTNFPKVLLLMSHPELCIFNSILLVMGIIMLYKLWKKKNKIYLLISFVLLCPWGIVTISDMKIIQISWILTREFSFLLFLLDMFILLIIYCNESKNMHFIPIMIAAVASVFCLIISPSFALRSCLPYVFCCYIVWGNIFSACIVDMYKQSNKGSILICLFITAIFSVCVLKNTYKIYTGYENNHYVDRYNYNTLKNYKDTMQEVYLVKYPNNKYRGFMSCDKGFEGTDYWIREYFDIPQNVQIKWKSLDEMIKMQYEIDEIYKVGE